MGDVYKLLPYSMYHSLKCCVIYDEHPRDNRKIDITVCLQGGKVVEVFERECVSSIVLPNVSVFKDIQILRNNTGNLFYIVAADKDVIILLSTDQLKIHQRFCDVLEYEICDPECNGEAKLMIKNSSIEFISFNSPKAVAQDSKRTLEDSKPVISTLRTKLTEAEYNLMCHEKTYKDIEKLRQNANFLCQGDDALKLKTLKPIVRFCNKKIVIQLEVENLYDESISDVCVFLHNTSCNSISYTSKVYEHLYTVPFFKELQFREIKGRLKASVVVVIDISEFQSCISSRIDFSVIVSYKRHNKNYLQSFDNVHISSGDVMGKHFDVFSNTDVDDRGLCIAMLSTTVKTKLCLRQKALSVFTPLSEIFREHLKMELGENKSMAIHKHSPHHILHGILIIFNYHVTFDVASDEMINYNIDLYTRSSSQVMALIHLLYDTVPVPYIVVTPSIEVSSHTGVLMSAVESHSEDVQWNNEHTECAKSLLKQTSMTLEYLDRCLTTDKGMSANKTNIKINLFAMGSDEFVKYRNSMMAEAKNGFEHLAKASAEISEVGVDEMDQD